MKRLSRRTLRPWFGGWCQDFAIAEQTKPDLNIDDQVQQTRQRGIGASTLGQLREILPVVQPTREGARIQDESANLLREEVLDPQFHVVVVPEPGHLQTAHDAVEFVHQSQT